MTLKTQKIINFGIIKIKTTINNLFITLTDSTGKVIISKHSGLLNFKSNKRKTPYVAGLVLKSLIKSFKKLNINIKLFIVEIHGADNIGRTFNVAYKLKELKITNILYIRLKFKGIHNGVRLQKKKRI